MDLWSVLQVMVLVMGPNDYKGLENSNFGKKLLIFAWADKRKALADLHGKRYIHKVINLIALNSRLMSCMINNPCDSGPWLLPWRHSGKKMISLKRILYLTKLDYLPIQLKWTLPYGECLAENVDCLQKLLDSAEPSLAWWDLLREQLFQTSVRIWVCWGSILICCF